MINELTALPADLGPGPHQVRLRAIRENQDARFGTTLIWEFICVEGEQKGHVHTRRTGSRLKPLKSLWLLVAGMLGRDLEINEMVDIDHFLGQRFQLRLRKEVRDESQIVVFDCISPSKD